MLTDTAIRKAKPLDRPYKLKPAAGGGLYIRVFPSGSKLWQLKYRRANGKETCVSLGRYPEVSLSAARLERDKIKQERKVAGIDPASQRRMDKLRERLASGDSFEAVANDWLKRHAEQWSEKRVESIESRLKRCVLPWLGSRPISEIRAPEVLQVLRRIESRGILETAHRLRQEIGMIFRFAVQNGRAESDPTPALKGALKARKVTHFAALTEPKEVGDLMRKLRQFHGSQITYAALQVAPLLFVRPGELRKAEWAEIDLDAAEWRVPAAKMKMRVAHLVPLAIQAVTVLRDLHPLTGSGRYVFPGVRDLSRPMSENTVLFALRRLGYSPEQMTGHGFRAMARTRLAEMGWNPDAIERQLAHKPSGVLGAAYDRAQFLGERRKMMQAWADYLDVLRDERKVIAGKFESTARISAVS